MAMGSTYVVLVVISLWSCQANAACQQVDSTNFFDSRCREDFRTASDHIFPDDVALLLDSYDYIDLISGSSWKTLDVDRTSTDTFGQWVERGSICQLEMRSCATCTSNCDSCRNTPACNAAITTPQDNWLFSTFIRFPNVPNANDVTEVFFNISFRFSQCLSHPDCNNPYATVYRYDTNSPVTDTQLKNTANYQLLRGTIENSRLQQLPGTTVVDVHWSIPKPNTNGFYLGFRDQGTCGQIKRVIVYYRRSREYRSSDTLLTCPSLPLPPQASSQTTMATCCCGEKAENSSSLDRVCRANGCTEPVSGVCGCSPGYEFNSATRTCVACSPGYFQPDISTSSVCEPCPANSRAVLPASAVCTCTGITIRDNNRPRDPCAEAPSSPLLANKPVVHGTLVTVCWGAAQDAGGLDDLHYNVYTYQVGTGEVIYNKVNDGPIAGSGQLCYEISSLNPSSSYAIVVTSANGATEDPDTLDQSLSSVQGRFVAFFVDTGETETPSTTTDKTNCDCTGITLTESDRHKYTCSEVPSSPLLANKPVVDGTLVTVCWGAAQDAGGLDDLHYNVYMYQVGTGEVVYNKVNNEPITGSGQLCYEISSLNLSSSYAVVVTSANGATGDPDTLDQSLSSVQGRFVAFFVDTGEIEVPSSPLLANKPVVDGTLVTVCWGAAQDAGGLDDLHYNVYTYQVGTGEMVYNKVNDGPIAGSGQLCYEISSLNPSSSYAIVVTSANGATGDPDTLGQSLNSVQGQFVTFFVDTGEKGLRKSEIIALTFCLTFFFVAVITALIVCLIMRFAFTKRQKTMTTSPKTEIDLSSNISCEEVEPKVKPMPPSKPMKSHYS